MNPKEETIYNEIVRVLTNYEHPEDSGLTKEECAEDIYFTLVKVQNAIDNGDLYWWSECIPK